jgi:hypothetical protein
MQIGGIIALSIVPFVVLAVTTHLKGVGGRIDRRQVSFAVSLEVRPEVVRGDISFFLQMWWGRPLTAELGRFRGNPAAGGLCKLASICLQLWDG